MKLVLKKQKLKKLDNLDNMDINSKATKKVAGGVNTLTGCYGATCVRFM
ncbi:hypothetical protein ACSLBF_09025 [Pseudoalteromonas sp. T1lg65]